MCFMYKTKTWGSYLKHIRGLWYYRLEKLPPLQQARLKFTHHENVELS